MAGPRLRAQVLEARERLAAGREKLKRLHDTGVPGIQVSAYLTELIDEVVAQLLDSALAELGETLDDAVSLVAHGGYGRRDMAPFSDVDLMLLYQEGQREAVQPLAQRLSQDICDAGLHLGFSFRSLLEASSLAITDPKTFTSVAESRLLAGYDPLFQRFLERLRRHASRRWRSLVAAIEAARQEERQKYGDTNFLLMPNIKRSSGGLRDIQLVRWIGFARYGERDLDHLAGVEALGDEDRLQLRKAREFLLRLRNELHFHAGRAHDVLDREEQVRLASCYGCQGDSGLLPVEQFMRGYFQQTSTVRSTVEHFVADAKTTYGAAVFLNWMGSHRVGREFRSGPLYLSATRQGREKLRTDLGEVLRLMDLANRYDKLIDHQTWKEIRLGLKCRPASPLSKHVADRFLSLLSQPGRLGDLLRRLHEIGVLEQLIPPLAHARCLLQFNEFHKYTVDEHSIRAVEEATRMLNRSGPLGEAYRSLKDKRLLHLALLLHDLGKGYPEDHCIVGARLAEETAAHLYLTQQEAETLRFLVLKHLQLSHLAQFRDIHDPDVVVDFAVEVGSPELLQLLYVLTCADLAAVGPDVLNDWKLDLFTQLYRNTYRQLSGQPATGDAELQRRRAELSALLPPQERDGWWTKQIDALPPDFLALHAPRELLADLRQLRQLDPRSVFARGRYLTDRQVVEYTVGTRESIAPGIFHRLTGVLSSQRMEIYSAEIHTLADGLVLDRFYVHDRDFGAEPDASRVDQVCRRLVDALSNPLDEPPRFPAVWGSTPRQAASRRHAPPTLVRVDHTTSERFTIIDVFAIDRLGLLYTIAREIFLLGLSVHRAKIGTHLDQVVDVFYVTDSEDRKVTDADRVEQIRSSVAEKIRQLEEQSGKG